MIKPRLDIPLYTVVEDSPAALVLENKGPRYLAAAGTVGLIALFLTGSLRLDQHIYLGADDVTGLARLFFASVVLFGLMGAFDRQRIVLESATRRVQFTSRLRPWKRFVRSADDIERVEVSSRTTTSYGEDSVVHHLHIVFRNKARREVNRSTDPTFIRGLAARIEGFRS